MLSRYDDWWSGTLPQRPDFGERYPWRMVRIHSLTSAFQRRIDAGLRLLDQAGDLAGWELCLSGGKDSTALALLVALARRGTVAAVSIRDGLCWPGEDRYLDAVATRTSLALRRVEVDADLRALASATPGALLEDQEDRAGALSGPWFEAANASRANRLWGLRAEESRARRLNRRARGALYTRADGITICAPLSDWLAIDVHAMLARHDVPPHPVYLCVDPGADPLRMRHAWWVAGGRLASEGGHYAWLRRWWPDLYELAIEIDPTVSRFA